MADIGYIALFLALVASLLSAIAYVFGVKGENHSLIKYARYGLLAACGLVTVSVTVLLYALITHNFQIEYVALYTNRDTSLFYLISALWAGNSGSLLFWAWLLSIFATIVSIQKRYNNKELVPYASAIIMLIQAFFIILLVSVANPFHLQSFIPVDGRGLNPILENPGMIIHPPLLLAGYIGFTVPFAFAIAALLTRRLGNEWLTAIRRWTLLSWLLLGIGNLIGAWWAYVELGWGGYWAWDPVENAGLMPWLVATAFLHSIVMQRRRGMLKVWNMVLIIFTFNLAIFGTFLTRSGILSSVHTFGETGVEPFFLTFLAISFFVSLGLLLYRKDELKSAVEVESLASREFTYYLNNLLFIGAALVIFLGTVFPAITEAIRGIKIEVGEAFFNTVNVPVFLAIIFLIGICTLLGWQQDTFRNLCRKLFWPFLTAIALSIIIFILGARQVYALVAYFICIFVFSAVLNKWFQETRIRQQLKAENFIKAFWSLFTNNRPRYGGYIIHMSIIIISVGIISSSIYGAEKDVTLQVGESMNIKSYTLTYDELNIDETPSKTSVGAVISVFRGDKLIDILIPQKFFHKNYEQPVSEVAIRTTPFEDLYIILGGWEEDQTAFFQVLVNPLVLWMWIGGGIFLLGGLVCFWPDRKKQSAPAADALIKDADMTDEIERQVRELRRGDGFSCPECGSGNPKGSRFCARCGTALNKGERF
ncbi:cytochrome c-type biogenesis CcmF C-terminal domain-containing protein [Chloroflexota bacterium]